MRSTVEVDHALIGDQQETEPSHAPHARRRGFRFRDSRRERLFLSSISFFLAFTIARSVAYAIRLEVPPFRNLEFGETHVHHLVWGILLLLVAGYVGLLHSTRKTWEDHRLGRLQAILYGIGAALTLDEFALWLRLDDVYWASEGRASIDAVIVFGTLLSIGIWGAPLWRWSVRQAQRAVRQGRRVRRWRTRRKVAAHSAPARRPSRV